MISITTVVQIQAESFVSDTKFLKAYANHTMLTPPQRAAHFVMLKISIHLCRSRPEKLNRTPQR